jgi:hypothetical protein
MPPWLIFVSHEPDDGPWLRMMVSNPFNDAMCPLVNTIIVADPLPHICLGIVHIANPA